MKPSELKSFIKEAVREAIQEELKDILLEAVRAPKLPIQETYQMSPVSTDTSTQVTNSPPQKSATEKRAMMESIMGDMRRGQDTISMTTANLNSFQVPTGVNTSAEGTSLPQGNVGLDQIMALMNK
jgi:hypothetical protein